MSAMITVFLDKSADARGSGALGSLWLYSDGKHSTSITLQFPNGTPLADQVKAAQSLSRGVQTWCDDLVAAAEQQRTAQDELAQAREEIARLKAEAGESA